MLPFCITVPLLLMVVGGILIMVYMYLLQKIVKSVDSDVELLKKDTHRIKNDLTSLREQITTLAFLKDVIIDVEGDHEDDAIVDREFDGAVEQIILTQEPILNESPTTEADAIPDSIAEARLDSIAEARLDAIPETDNSDNVDNADDTVAEPATAIDTEIIDLTTSLKEEVPVAKSSSKKRAKKV